MRFLHCCGAAWNLLLGSRDHYFEVRDDSGSDRTERITAMLVAILNFLQSWRRYNTSLRELYQLGDRELADIGISRSDIPRVAWDAANGR